MVRTTSNLSGQRVVLALSGGVDSAVAATLLLQQGAEVHALHMTNWADDDGYCTAAADLQDARNICEQLRIPLHHVNFAREYRERVFAFFLDEYRAGRTPNPDVLCNREIKFGVFREYAHRLGGSLLATGHYARTRLLDGRTQLLRALDENKDQSYFLHAVSEAALAETVFPLGALRKEQVRAIARDHALEVHDKKDSTGICFIGERPFREFLATYLPSQPGRIETPDGAEVGKHHGLMYYTLGQRRGLGIGGRQDAGDEPWFVAAKRLEDNVLVVVQGEHELLYSSRLQTAAASWINDQPEPLRAGRPWHCQARIRFRQAAQACIVRRAGGGGLELSFESMQRAATPGQYAVFYAGERCLGGAVIEQAAAGHDALREAM